MTKVEHDIGQPGILLAIGSNWPLVLSGGLLVVVILLAIFAPVVVGHDPAQMNPGARLTPPSWDHPFGTDQFGRDVLARVIYGARTSLEVALTAVSIAVLIGGTVGFVSGYVGGWFDAVLMRLMDVLIAFPSLLLALFLVAVLGADLVNLIIAISLTRVPYFARMTRAEAASLASRPFITAARTMGASDIRIVSRHIVPNVIPILIIFATTDLANAIIAESALSYLGLGAQPPTSSWGRMLNESRGFESQAPWLAIVPGFFVMMTVISFNLFGDGLRDYLDPRLKGRS